MSTYRRNILVGVTVLAALGVLGWMILKFGGSTAALFRPPTKPISFVTARADGVGEGSPILYRGVGVGRVLAVRRGDNLLEVVVDAEVDKQPPLPANVEGRIVAQSLLGAGSAISLELTDAQPRGELSAGAKLVAHYVGLDVLPPAFAQLAEELSRTARQLRETELIPHLDGEVRRVGQLVESMRTVVDDPKTREDLKASIASVRSATEKADRIASSLEKLSGELASVTDEAKGTFGQARTTIARSGEQVDQISRQLLDRMEQIAKLLERVNSISAKIDTGEGTAGKMVNDPRLYEALVDTAIDLKTTVSDLKRLVEQWEQEGVTVKLR